MAGQLESPTLGRGSDWNSFYGTEPFAGNAPFSPSAFGLLLFGEVDAAGARDLLEIPDALGSLTFSDIGGTIGLDQLPPGSLVSVDDIDENAIYFFDDALGLPRLIGASEAATFIGGSLTFGDIGGTIDISQFPDGSVATIESIDEDALYYFDNVLFTPKLVSADDAAAFLSGHLSFGDINGTLGTDQFPSGSVATLDPIDEDALYFFDDDTETPSLIGKADVLAFLLPDQTGEDGNFLQTNAGVLSWAAASGGSGDVSTDAIWDAKGDLAVGTGADTAAKLTVGANDTMLMADSGQTTGLKWGSPSTVRTALGLVIGTDVQAFDADLSTWATKTPYAGTLTITTGKTFGVTNNLTLSGTDGSTLAIGTGGTLGTAAYTSSGAYQPIDSDLTTIAGLTATTDNFIVSVSSAWASRTPAQVKTTLAIANTDVSGLGTASTLASDTDGTLATNSDSRIATQKAVKTYIDGINTALLAAIAALDSKDEVAYCSTSALPSCTYSNGTLGVGATLTATANGPLIIDSVTTVLGAQGFGILVAGQASDFQNGWYTLTQQGVVAVSPWILTRRTPDDQAAEIGPGYLTAVEAPTGLTAGSNNQRVFLSISPVPFVVGTDSLTFAMVGGTYTAGNGLSLSGTAFSINTSITADLSTAQSLTNKKLGSLTGNGFVKTSGGDGTLSVDTASYQPLDSDLTTLAGLTATTDNFIISVSSAWASRTPAQARTTLGLVIGTNVQAWDADLDTLAGLTPTTDNFIVSVSSAWASRTPSQVRTTLGLVIGTNVQAWDADLDTWSGITPGTGVGTFLATPSSANLRTALTDENGTGVALFDSCTSATFITPTIAKISNLTTNGVVKTTGGDGTLSVDTNAAWTTLWVTGSPATTTGQVLVDITGLVTGTLANSTQYEFEVVLYCTTSAVNTGIQFGIHGGGTGTAATCFLIGQGATGSNTANIQSANAIDTATTATLTTSGMSGAVWFRGFATTRSTGTATLSVQFLKTTSGTATVNVGSVFRYRIAGT